MMFGNNNNEGGIEGGEGGGVEANELEAARLRARYQQYIRIGILLCLLLLLMDSPPNPPTPSSSQQTSTNNQIIGINDAKLLNEVYLHSSQAYYAPHNITGLFRGTWSQKKINETKEITGNIIIQVKSLEIQNVPNLHFLYGFCKLYSVPKSTSPHTTEDILYPVQGLYIPSSGESTLITTPTTNHRIFLAIPVPTNSPNQTTSTSSSTKSEKRFLTIYPPPYILENYHNFENNEGLNWNIDDPVVDPFEEELEKNLEAITLSQNIQHTFQSIWTPKQNSVTLTHSEREVRSLRSTTEINNFNENSNGNGNGNGNSNGNNRNSHPRHPSRGSSSPPVSNSPSITIPLNITSSNDIIKNNNINNNNQTNINDFKSTNGSATISVSIKPTMKSRIIPGDTFGHFISNGADIERYHIGPNGLEILLVISKNQKPSNKPGHSTPDEHIGGFGYGSVPSNFKLFQQSHGISRGYQQSSKCNFGLKLISTKYDHHQHLVIHPIHNNNNNNNNNNNVINNNENNVSDTKISKSKLPKDKFPSIKSYQSQVNGKSITNGPEICKKEPLQFEVTAVYYKINYDVVERKVYIYSVLFTFCCFLQIYLLMRQMKYSSTPAAAGKISVLGISNQAVLDAGICIVHLLSSSSLTGYVFYILLGIAFLKLIIFCILEMRLVISIYQARYAQEMAAAGWQGLRNHLATLHARFYAALFGVILLVDFFFESPVIIVLALYSFWIPQIAYSAYSGARKPLDPMYTIGITISRLLFPLYIFGCPNNVYHMLTERSTLSIFASIFLVLWLLIQVIIILLQDRWGPRFFVPARFLPVRYNYFRPIPRRTIDHEAGGVECVICYTVVDQERNYMITPCDHLFHQECLSRWLEVKLECPVCRAPLPADD